MKLRNKKTGEIVDLAEGHICETNYGTRLTISPVAVLDKSYNYNSLAELNAEWEDYEEPKDHWHITFEGVICDLNPKSLPEHSRNAKSIGNYFETKEEAEKAVEKLKAWKRLRDRGFKFKDWKTDVSLKNAGVVETTFNLWDDLDPETVADLDLLFNQEDN